MVDDRRKADRGRTNGRVVRVSDDLWNAAKAKAEERGERLSDVIRQALAEYAGTPDVTGVHGRGSTTIDAANEQRRKTTNTEENLER